MITDYLWIDDSEQIHEIVFEAKASTHVAFDTEFERINTYYPKPSLFQLNIDGKLRIIDVKAIENLDFVRTLLSQIIVHSGSEDFEILFNIKSDLALDVHDTQIAASLCGFGLHCSYQNLVAELLDIHLDKAHSRSDWMQRPLSNEQIQYALEDVLYLYDLNQILLDKVQQKGLLDLYSVLVEKKLESVKNNNDPLKKYLKITSSKKYNEDQKKLIFSLLQWREKIAKQRNKPRGWILKNDQVISIALNKPLFERQFIHELKLYPAFVKYNKDSIIELYETSQAVDVATLPSTVKLNNSQAQVLNQIRSKLEKRCKELDIPSAVIANTAQLKSLATEDLGMDNLDLWKLIS